MIEFKQVDKIYPGGTKALDNVTLTINDGEFVGIIGRSGAGKSTLIRAINKMHDIQNGQILVDNVDVSKLKGKKLREYRQKIGMIFQSFNLVEKTSVFNNVLQAFVPKMSTFKAIFGLYKKEDKIRALNALDQVDILEKAFVRADHLSGGQKQRVALARTLAQNTNIILADEPVASLDPVNAKEVMDYFKKINKEENIAILINIHHVDIALEYCDRIIGINKGRVVYDGPSNQVTQEVLDGIYR